ncbi:MAG: hypothetical protein IPN33_19790 [Saprospiraceae bacterium]|nr:hypothetical protein [Saprospiraceae bacterium]
MMLLLFVLPLTVKEVHYWAEHMDPRLQCHPGEGETHLHDAHYAFHHCDYCAIGFSSYITPFATSIEKVSTPEQMPCIYLYQPLHSTTVQLSYPLRGPPVCA